MEKKKIIIVDDHSLFAKSLAFMVKEISDFDISHIFNNGLDFINFYKKNNEIADIVLLDMNMPVMNGIETMKWINKNLPNQKVIALSVNDDEQVVLIMAKLGIKGYLLKDCEPEYFKEALEVINNGGYFYSDKISKYIFKIGQNKVKTLFNERETEFIKLSCSEMTYKEIASTMCLSPKTIDNYRESVFDKLNVKSRIGVVLYAMKNNMA